MLELNLNDIVQIEHARVVDFENQLQKERKKFKNDKHQKL